MRLFFLRGLLVCLGCLVPVVGCAAPQGPSASGTLTAPAEEDSGMMPYRVGGEVYYPRAEARGYSVEGVASWYGPKFHGLKTSSGEVYNMNDLTAAHKTLPFGTRVRVTHLENGREVVVRINDRGPFVDDRLIDLSYRAGLELDLVQKGTGPVRLTVLQAGLSDAAPAAGSVYSIQVGVFRDRDNALSKMQTLPAGRILPIRRDGADHYRVLTGTYPSYERALERMDDLRNQGETRAFIVLNP